MTEFEEDDNKGRTIFKKLFGKFFRTLFASSDQYGWFDISGQTFTNSQRVIEIKNRQRYSVSDWTGGTYLEEYKRDKFKELHLEKPNYELYYMCFYKDGWVCFKLNERINACTSEWLATYPVNLPATTSINTGWVTKQVAMLRYDNEEYGDKIGYYENN